MRKRDLSHNERLVLYGLTRFPQLNDRQLSERLGIVHSTLTTIKHRLRDRGYYKVYKIPQVQNLGCELMGVLYTEFNPSISAEERTKRTSEKVEVFDEIVYSVGEVYRGFSISFSPNYTTMERINDIRTELFVDLDVMGETLPTEVYFPLELSKVIRFFDFHPLLEKMLGPDFVPPEDYGEGHGNGLFKPETLQELSKTEKMVLQAMVENPEMNSQQIGKVIGYSRHTVSDIKKWLESINIIKTIVVPDFKKLDMEILSLFHMKISPFAPKDRSALENSVMASPSVFFMIHRPSDIIILSLYRNYDEFKEEKAQRAQLLKDHGFAYENPVNNLHSLNKSIVIKDLTFAPLLKNLLTTE